MLSRELNVRTHAIICCPPLPRSLPRPLPCPRLHDKIMEVGGSRVQIQQAKVDQLSSEIDGCTAGITKAGVASKTSERCVVGVRLHSLSSPY